MNTNMTASEFREKGFLQELNRKFLHPMGLALQVIGDKNGNITGFGQVTHVADDLEGMRFIDLSDNDSIKKAEYVEKYFNERKQIREKALGYIIQPMGDKINTQKTMLADTTEMVGS